MRLQSTGMYDWSWERSGMLAIPSTPPKTRSMPFGSTPPGRRLRLGCLLDAQSVQFFNTQKGKVFLVAAARIAYSGDLTVFESKRDVQMVHVFIRMNKEFMRRKSLCEC